MGLKNKYLHNILLIILILFLTITSFPSGLAGDYYADISIDVDDSGFVSIDGITNHPDFLVEDTEVYTSKKQSYWLLNITKEEVFSDFIYVLTLPEDSSINYVKSSSSIRIEEDFGNLLIRGFGQNKSFSVTVQYQIKKDSNNLLFLGINSTTILLISVILIIVIALILFFIIKNKKKSEEIVIDKMDYNLKGLNERQREIIKLLIDKKRPLTQSDIQKELGIPKAAVSRNIHGLELKGIIEIEKIGMSNLIRLKKN